MYSLLLDSDIIDTNVLLSGENLVIAAVRTPAPFAPSVRTQFWVTALGYTNPFSYEEPDKLL